MNFAKCAAYLCFPQPEKIGTHSHRSNSITPTAPTFVACDSKQYNSPSCQKSWLLSLVKSHSPAFSHFCLSILAPATFSVWMCDDNSTISSHDGAPSTYDCKSPLTTSSQHTRI